ncbi:exonuclease domain-containing protein [Lachnoanaerobaculum orale]|uniref:Exonuclease domain-containing protein n=1 Tax=Lachnoanaerobaculum orale TaxID=979627 RepID=A0A3P3Q7Q4_9FIRM|nr:3'-5' exonuclease [Lachnoanaerobaculum orale]RRJ17252.1 exonuclease domain-containing protein [Lachnoanaerobaculum orale]
MKHIVVDLEMNSISNKYKDFDCTMETIEIGAIMLDENYQEISSFRTYVRPEYNNRIRPLISRLTGITYDMVINAPKFDEAMKMFSNWCLGVNDDIKIYAWSENDYKQISKEISLKKYELSLDEERVYLTEWHDFQAEFDKELGFEKQLSLKMALDMAGVDFLGREHSALDDARNTAKLFNIFNDREMFDCTLKKIAEAMKPTDFRTSLGSMFDLSGFAVA